MTTKTDSLQFLPMDKWAELEEVFKADWPLGISGYTALKTQRELMRSGLDYGFRVYCPYGDVANGMAALNRKDKFNEVVIHSLKLDTSELENALVTTNVIDWSETVIVPCLPPHTYECMRRVAQRLSLEVGYLPDENHPHELVLFDQDKPAFADVLLPEHMTFKPLSEEHVDVVDSVWPNRYDSSKWFFTLLIRNNLSFGLFKKDVLIAWVFVDEIGALCHLYTVDKFRKMGYAKLVMKLLCNKFLEEKKPVFGYCVEGNKDALRLYESLGFEKYYRVWWVTLSPK